MKQVVDESEVVQIDVSGEVWPPGPHEEIHIGQVAEEPAAHKKGTHGKGERTTPSPPASSGQKCNKQEGAWSDKKICGCISHDFLK